MVSPKRYKALKLEVFWQKQGKGKKTLKTLKLCLTQGRNFLYKGRLGNDIAC